MTTTPDGNEYICPNCDSDIFCQFGRDETECEECHTIIIVNWDSDEGRDATTLHIKEDSK